MVRSTLRFLFCPLISHPDKVAEWKLNAFHRTLSVFLLLVPVPFATVFFAAGSYYLSALMIASIGVFVASYRLLRKGRLYEAVLLMSAVATICALSLLLRTHTVDSMYVMVFTVLAAGIFSGPRAAFVLAGLHTLILAVVATADPSFTILPNMADFFTPSAAQLAEPTHFSTALFVCWVGALLSMLFQSFFSDLLKKVTQANLMLEAKVAQRTAELNVLNDRLTQALQTEKQLARTIEEKAREEKGELESQLFHARKMEAIGQLAGGVAHDFNNMLTAIIGYAGILSRKLGRDSEHYSYVDGISSAGKRAADLTSQLLTFARKGAFKTVPVDINRTIKEVLKLVDRTIDKRVEPIARLNASPSTTRGDPAMLQNALLNLAINARDAMSKQGGTLTFSTSITQLEADHPLLLPFEIEPGEYLVVEVEDTGSGIPPHIQSRIFEPFFTTKEQGKGTGLGLAAVYGCVKNHRGAIQVKSTVGVGTTFTMYLPAVRVSVPFSETESGEFSRHTRKSGRVLVVEDDDSVRRVATELLGSAGYTVEACSNGPDALDYMARHADEVDIVLLDMIMPKLSGHDTFVGIRQIVPAMRVVFVSGHNLEVEQKELAGLEGVGFLQKPFSRNQLLIVVEALLRPAPAATA